MVGIFFVETAQQHWEERALSLGGCDHFFGDILVEKSSFIDSNLTHTVIGSPTDNLDTDSIEYTEKCWFIPSD